MVSLQSTDVNVLADGTRVYELPADTETPVSAYLKVAHPGPAFLLESVVGGERLGRYSFIGLFPEQVWVLRSGGWEIQNPWERTHTTVAVSGDPLAVLQSYLRPPTLEAPSNRHLPRFTGGWVGYLSYEIARYFEPVLGLAPDPSLPESVLLETGILIAFDHAYNKMLVIARPGRGGSTEAEARLAEVIARLRQPNLPAFAFSTDLVPLRPIRHFPVTNFWLRSPRPRKPSPPARFSKQCFRSVSSDRRGFTLFRFTVHCAVLILLPICFSLTLVR